MKKTQIYTSLRILFCSAVILGIFLTAPKSSAALTGPELWSATYAGPEGHSAKLMDMVIDESGSIILVGSIRDEEWNNLDFLTVKY